MKKNNLKITFSLIFLVSFMFFLTFAAVPLYKLFCQVTGYGGTPKIVDIKDQIDINEIEYNIFTNYNYLQKLNEIYFDKTNVNALKNRIAFNDLKKQNIENFYTVGTR